MKRITNLKKAVPVFKNSHKMDYPLTRLNRCSSVPLLHRSDNIIESILARIIKKRLQRIVKILRLRWGALDTLRGCIIKPVKVVKIVV